MKYRHLKDTVTDSNTGETICLCCARVVEENIPEEARPVSYEEKTLIHYGKTTNDRHDLGLATKISQSRTDFAGDTIKVNNQQLFFKLRKLDNHTPANWHKSEGRRLVHLLQTLEQVCQVMHISKSIKEAAVVLLRKCNKIGLTRGRPTKAFVSACVYMLCKQVNIVYPREEFVTKLDIHPTTFKQNVKQISFEFEIKTHNGSKTTLATFQKYCNNLRIPRKLILQAQEVIELCHKKAIGAGCKPAVLAATVLYVVVINNNSVAATLDDIADAFGISPPATRNLRKEMVPFLHELGLTAFPDSIKKMESFA